MTTETTTRPLYRPGQWLNRKFRTHDRNMVKPVMIKEVCPVPTPEGEWRYWYSYAREDLHGVLKMHLAVADESEFTT